MLFAASEGSTVTSANSATQTANSAETASIFENIRGHFDKYVVEHGPELLGNILAAAAIFFIGQWVVKLLAKLLEMGLNRARFDRVLVQFLVRIAKPVMMLLVIIAALGQLGVETTQLSAILAAMGLAVGLSLQGSLSNFASGILLIVFRPFKVGDFVAAGSAKGIVEEVHIFHTIMRTPDNVRVVVPNSSITSDTISNFSAEPTRRIDLVVGCGYDDDLPAVKRFLEQLVNDHAAVLSEPQPVVAVDELADSCVNFVVRPWVASADYWQTRWDLTESIKLGFDERGFQIPFPQQDLHVHQVAVSDDAKPGRKASTLDQQPMTQVAPKQSELIAPRRVA